MPDRQGALRLFRAVGIDVFLHWSWFLVAFYEISSRSRSYSSPFWNVLEYLTLFAIVLAHEFGHALACRSVGGEASQIVLWPLGGVAYVKPPQRPGATLWSLAAGPLVNLILVPVTLLALFAMRAEGATGLPNAYAWLGAVTYINIGLLVFNLLPIYPLDGGQILRSLLWFVIGRARSLLVATVLGFVGVAVVIVAAIAAGSTWLLVLAAFMLLNCWRGLQHARVLARLAKVPRRPGFACPDCRTEPPSGAVWRCSQCAAPFDTFATGAVCPACGKEFERTACLDCGSLHPLRAWQAAVPAARPA